MKGKKIPLRQCIGCRQMNEKKEMVRVVKKPEGEILFDAKGNVNGRGCYLCKDIDCLQKAIKSKAISRSLKVSVSEDVYVELERELIQNDEPK